MATKKTLEKKLAKLEFIHDQLITELTYVDRLMQLVGFAGGIAALKATAQELHMSGDALGDTEDFEKESEDADYQNS
ncbi:MAG: hypothetical protein ACXU9U_02490 [Parachlamydiaceae bacterium]